jgi:hypothetical protein
MTPPFMIKIIRKKLWRERAVYTRKRDQSTEKNADCQPDYF